MAVTLDTEHQMFRYVSALRIHLDTNNQNARVVTLLIGTINSGVNDIIHIPGRSSQVNQPIIKQSRNEQCLCLTHTPGRFSVLQPFKTFYYISPSLHGIIKPSFMLRSIFGCVGFVMTDQE